METVVNIQTYLRHLWIFTSVVKSEEWRAYSDELPWAAMDERSSLLVHVLSNFPSEGLMDRKSESILQEVTKEPPPPIHTHTQIIIPSRLPVTLDKNLSSILANSVCYAD